MYKYNIMHIIINFVHIYTFASFLMNVLEKSIKFNVKGIIEAFMVHTPVSIPYRENCAGSVPFWLLLQVAWRTAEAN